MVKYDYYTGELSNDGSPPLSEQEIVQNANLINPAYDYDPQQRLNQMQAQQQQQMMYGGYYTNGMPQYGYPQNTFYAMNYPQYGGYQSPSGFSGYAGNPAFQYMQGSGYQSPYMTQQQDYTYYVPGFNTGSRELLPHDVENICNELQNQMMMELEEANVKRMEQQKSYYNALGYNNGYNYYGMPYMNTFYADPQIVNKYKQKIENIKKEARESRTNLNKNLSRLCQNYLEGTVDEERIEEIYAGKTVTVPGQQIQYDYKMQMLASMVPADNSTMYQQHHAQVSAEVGKYFENTTDMNTFLRDCGQLISAERLEAEDHKRRDGSNLYQQNGAYRALIRQKIKDKHQMETGGGEITLPGLNPNQNGSNIPMGESFPTLNQSARMLDDGTLQISAPAWLGNKQYVVKNAMEDDYEKNRQLFIQSIYRDNPRPGGGSNGS
jgi:hypothetical protein